MKKNPWLTPAAALLLTLPLGGCTTEPHSTAGLIPSFLSSSEDTFQRITESWQEAESWWSSALSGDTFQSAAAPGRSVNQLLAKLRGETDAQLRDEARRSDSARQQQLREQLRPGDPSNAIQKQNAAAQNRIANLQDRLQNQQEAQEEQQEKSLPAAPAK